MTESFYGFILWKLTTIKVGVFALVGLLVEYFDDNLKIFYFVFV